MADNDLTAQRLREVLTYDPETGAFAWHPNHHGGRLRNKQPGHVSKETGHVNIRVLNRAYEAHRLAWLYMTGAWPILTIDHRNRIPADNRWANLRLASMAQQRQNQKVRKDNKVGLKGVERRYENLWRATLTIGGKRIHLGYFKTPHEAVAARTEAERIHFTHSPACEPQAESPDAPGLPDETALSSPRCQQIQQRPQWELTS